MDGDIELHLGPASPFLITDSGQDPLEQNRFGADLNCPAFGSSQDHEILDEADQALGLVRDIANQLGLHLGV